MFAVLKGQFQSLCKLWLVMRTQVNMKIAMHWIQCCVILHNMIIQFEEELGVKKTTDWARWEEAEPYHSMAPIVVDAPKGTPGQAFHADLMLWLDTHLRSWAGRVIPYPQSISKNAILVATYVNKCSLQVAAMREILMVAIRREAWKGPRQW